MLKSAPPRISALLLAGALLAIPLAGCKGRSLSSLFHHRKAKSAENTEEYSDTLQQAVASGQSSMLKLASFSQDQPAVQKFYEDRNWELAWSRNGKPTASAVALIQHFTDADKKGLRPEDYDGQAWQDHLRALANAPSDGNTVAQFDVAMTVAAVRLLQDLHLGRINPQSLNFDIDVPAKRAAFDVATVLNDQIVDTDNVDSVLSGVEPQNPLYKKTEEALPHYLDLAEKQGSVPPVELPAVSKAVGPGGSYPGLQQLVARLALEGDAPEGSGPPAGNQYTPEIAQAVQHFQARVGLNPDGKLSQGTVDALNIPIASRVQQIDLALERWRWLPDAYQKPRLLVNLPEYVVRAYDQDGNLDFKMRVVDGQSKDNHNTPVFVRTMKYLVFRPFWNLPVSIVKKDLLKHVGSGYMESHGYEVVNRNGQPVTGWSADDLEHSRYLVRQKPGPKNSLGLIKFMFPNEYDIYMHSTPEMSLFNLSRRDRSHGCVRLQDAEKMANWVLQGQPEWDADKIHQAMYGEPLDNDADAKTDAQAASGGDPDSGTTSASPAVKDNRQVNLKTQLPVVLTYLTANADEDGTLHFFNDVYGYDKQLQAALDQPRPYRREPVKINPKVAAGETL